MAVERLPNAWTTRCARRISRRRLLKVGGASIAGAALLGVAGCGGGADQEGAGASDTRLVGHELGEAQVPRDPRRVMALDPVFTLQSAVEVGVPVVGSTVFSPEQPFPATLSITQFERNPLWETLPAVQEGRVLQVPRLVYNGGNHYSYRIRLYSGTTLGTLTVTSRFYALPANGLVSD